MSSGAGRGEAVASSRLEVRGRREAGDVRGPRRGDGGLLVRPPAATLDQRASRCGLDHPARGGGDGAVVVEHRQHERLHDDCLAEGGGDGEHGREREEHLTFAIRVDTPSEPVGRQVSERGPTHQACRLEVLQIGFGEAELSDGVDQSSQATEDPVPVPRRQGPREDLEHGRELRPFGTKRGIEHGELVGVRVQPERARELGARAARRHTRNIRLSVQGPDVGHELVEPDLSRVA
jgi:hypothetical protein